MRHRPTLPRGVPANVVLLLLVVGLLHACSTATPTPPTPSGAEIPPVPLTLQLAWVHEYSSSPFYAAAQNGHFSDEGLEVQFDEGGFNSAGFIDPISQVLDGTADMGMSSSAGVIAARAEGKPVVAIGNIFQRSPLAVISLASSNILQPKDLIGRTVLVAQDTAQDNFLAMLRLQQIDPTELTILPRTTFGIEPLTNGDVDAIVAWVINEGVQVREAGQEPNIMLFSDYGIDSYDFVIFTSEQMLQERPEHVAAFMRAVNRGIADVIANPEQAVEYTLLYNSTLDRAGQRTRLEISLPLIRPTNTQIGGFDSEIWQLNQQLLLDNNRITQPVNLDHAFTSDFVVP